jgi:hypothetical protein
MSQSTPKRRNTTIIYKKDTPKESVTAEHNCKMWFKTKSN